MVDHARLEEEADVRAGLTASPKTLPPKYFYDARGSELFDEITRLPEYYPTRAERAILAAHAGEIAALTRAQSLVEIGSGTSEKTRLLLQALRDAGTLSSFVPFDVDPAGEYPDEGSPLEIWLEHPLPDPLAELGDQDPPARIVELEVLGPLTTLAPGAATALTIRATLA